MRQNSGNQGIFTSTYDLGKNCGTFDFTYDAFTIPDQFQILFENQILLDTGSISNGTTIPITYTGSTSMVSVVVIANLTGTAWTYTIGCPVLSKN